MPPIDITIQSETLKALVAAQGIDAIPAFLVNFAESIERETVKQFLGWCTQTSASAKLTHLNIANDLYEQLHDIAFPSRER
jgi:hypothetical protein